MSLTPRSARTEINKILDVGEHRVIYTDHAKKRMKKRKVLRAQVMKCLRHGLIQEGPARSAKGSWEMKINSVSAGDDISIVVALDYDNAGNKIIIITAYKG